MPERWRRELAKVDRTSPDIERIRDRTNAPSRFPNEPGSRRSRVAAALSAIVVFALAVSVFVIPTLRASRGEPTPTAPASPSPSSYRGTQGRCPRGGPEIGRVDASTSRQPSAQPVSGPGPALCSRRLPLLRHRALRYGARHPGMVVDAAPDGRGPLLAGSTPPCWTLLER